MNELNERQVSTNLRTVFYGGFVSRAGTRSYVRFWVVSSLSALRTHLSESRQSAAGPEAAMTPDQGRRPIRLPDRASCSN